MGKFDDFGKLNSYGESMYMYFAPVRLGSVTQELHEKQLKEYSLKRLETEKQEALRSVRVKRFGIYKASQESSFEVVLEKEELPRTFMRFFFEFLLYAITYGLWYFFRKPHRGPKSIRLTVNDDLSVNAWLIKWR